MANTVTSNVKISGLSTVFPRRKITNRDLDTFSLEEIEKNIALTGVRSRYVVDDQTTTSDLCYAAAQSLLQEQDKSTIDGVIFVSQTPDYVLPATACVLQHRLGLGSSTFAFDVNQGCSGYVYGLWLASSLIDSGQCRNVLLLVGDTCTKFVSPNDKGTSLLFGDAGSATLLSYVPNSDPFYFVLGSDGSGMENLIIPGGGFREKSSELSRQSVQQPDGSLRSREELYMNGGEIFNFTIRAVPKLVKKVFELSELGIEDHHNFVFHQANLFMLKHLQKKLKIPDEKFWLTISEYGNTSSASIPLTLSKKLSPSNPSSLRAALFGFGVGYSWAGASITIGKDTRIIHSQERSKH